MSQSGGVRRRSRNESKNAKCCDGYPLSDVSVASSLRAELAACGTFKSATS